MKRSKFSLSCYKLFTCDMGELVPCNLIEVLPGDSFQAATSALVRVSPLLAPVMHPVHVRIHHWFVPTRLLWDNWEDFITGGPDGNNASVIPHIGGQGMVKGSIFDYMGIPPGIPGSFLCSALPFRAYNLIWNEYYRDQDLQAELTVNKGDGLDSGALYSLQHVAWEKDYFTSARPWTQKGPDVTIPFADTAPVVTNSLTPQLNWGANFNQPMHVGVIGSENGLQAGPVPGVDTNVTWGEQTGMVADLSGATAINVNDLREAFAIQRYEEARARYGSRYTEYLRYLGVRSSDARLQRPEYLGGGRQTIQFSEVLQTGPDTADEGVANLKGHGIGAMRSNRYRRFFEEHGYIITLLSVKPKTMYAQAVPKMWHRQTKHDYFQQELQHIGQQEVLNREVFAHHTQPNGVFGYQDRYDEYRRAESSIAGDFRDTLNHWHYARIFANDPALNADFVKSVPTKRVNAEQTEDCLWIMANHSVQARRMVAPMGKSFIY